MTRVMQTVLMLAAVATAACSEAPASPNNTPSEGPLSAPLPTIVGTIDAQAAGVGRPFTFDVAASTLHFVDPVGAGVSVSVSLPATSLGLSIAGTRVIGVPTEPGIVFVTVTARDARGRQAEMRFPVIVLSADLDVPMLPSTPYAYSDASAPLPHHVANSPQVFNTDNTPAVNRITDAGAALGRVLFYDRRLSLNDRVSCATCHQQQFSFSDTLQLSVGFRGERTNRHSMPLTNTRFYRPSRFFRDERAATLEALVLQPISDAVEMGLPPDLLVPKLQLTPFYAGLYAAAFGDSAITPDRTARALAQFVRALRSTNAKLDSTIGGGVQFSPIEQEGFQLFDAAGCRGCHESYVAVSDSARNNGLSSANTDPGAGRGKFKAPSLRNVAVRPPYMHDGRFRTLEAVIDFYDSGIEDNPDLDRTLRGLDGRPRRFLFSAREKSALIAFLQTLTDRTFLVDPRFSDPFPRQ